jgi:PKHD-type hydroxylase
VTELGQFAFPLNATSHEQSVAWWDNAFDHDDLKRIVALGDSLPAEAAQVGGPTSKNGTSPDTRACKVAWINANPDSGWLFERLGNMARELNSRYFGFDLWGLESLQYTIYDGAVHGEFYDWHIDTMGKGNQGQRKLSFVVQLSEAQDYEGGELWVHGKAELCVPKCRGLLYAFPSYTLHRVTPVTAGVRKTLVGWIVGPQFR